MKRKSKKKLSPLLRRLEKHDPLCAVHVYSGDGHCSCGLAEALQIVEQLKTFLKDNPGALRLLSG